MSGKLTVECLAWRPLRRNTLLGFARIRIAELDLTIHDIAVHESHGKLWAQPPARLWVKDGVVVTGDDGKVQYAPILEFGRREVRDAFSDAVVRAVLTLNPRAFAKESAA